MCGTTSDPPDSMKCDAAGEISTRQDPLGKGIEVGSGSGPLGFFIRCGEFDPTCESPPLGCTALNVLCVASKYSHW